jgi:glycosyltransferase involved in cell wall biosynthesis
MLVSLARAVRDHAAKVVVVTEGEGAEVLADALGSDPDLPLLVLPYQPFELMPEMLATADVLLALLQASASPFSVPSKTLSYLCAGRPVVASMPRTNLAARIIVDEAGAGRVVDSGDAAAFVAAVLALAADSEERLRLGSSARAYAERAFDPASIRTAFLDAAGLPCRFST